MLYCKPVRAVASTLTTVRLAVTARAGPRAFPGGVMTSDAGATLRRRGNAIGDLWHHEVFSIASHLFIPIRLVVRIRRGHLYLELLPPRDQLAVELLT